MTMTKKDFEGTTVLITGASSGIGEAFARNLASKGVNLILTARSQDKLIRIADELRKKHPISVQVFPADLSRIDAPQQLIDQIRTSGSSVDVLINNAGFGKWAHFLAEDIDTYQRMLSLNINALVRLTYLCLPDMLSRGKGGVINVASTAAFQPVPYIAVYSASKSFVLNFTEALSGEYRKTGLRFLALCPGYTATNFMAVANADTSGIPLAAPDDVAEAAINAFLQSRNYHVPGVTNYLTSLLPRILSRSAAVKIVANMFRHRVVAFPAKS
jgi:short-subunit dehydrogenase